MNHEGIGMGLMICQKLVIMNQGVISAHSDGEDKGSQFCFTMKMRKVAATEITEVNQLVSSPSKRTVG